MADKRKASEGGSLAAAAMLLGAVAVPAQGAVDAQRDALQARVEAVRQALTDGAPGPITLVAAANWDNWPKWGKWSNWVNR